VLYVTTRDSNDPQTAYKTLHNNVASDGGCYIPFRLESFTPEYLAALKDKSFGQAIADILNYFFSVSISGWDVDFCIGRNACKFFNLSSNLLPSPSLLYTLIFASCIFAIFLTKANPIPVPSQPLYKVVSN